MNYFLTICFLVSAMLLPTDAKAVVLDNNFDLNQLKNRTLAYYTGSFDPLHLGHEHLIEETLRLGYADFVLIYPVPGGDPFKNRTDLALRQKMIAGVFKEHPRVLITSWSPKELQDKLAPLTTEMNVIGIIGSDVVIEGFYGPDKEKSEKYRNVFMHGIPLKEKHYEDTAGALMALKANAFVVSLREDVDLTFLNGKIADRPVCGFIQSKTNSSTNVRKAIQNREPFEHLVPYPVQDIIKQEGLYSYSRTTD